MIDHNEADVLAAAASVGTLDATEQRDLREHLDACAECSRTAAEYMAAAGMLTLSVDDARPSPELRTRLMRAVYSEAMRADTAPRPSRWQQLLDRVPRGRGVALAAGAAAGVVVGGTTVGLVTRGGQPSTLSVALAGQAAAPGAYGTVQFDRALDVSTMTISGLADPSAMSSGSAVWEVWLIPSSGAPVPAGYLTHSPSGAWTAAMTGDLTRYHAAAVTNEPAGGSMAPTGQVVVEGTISG